MEQTLKAGQVWAFRKNECCEYSRFLKIDWVKGFRFGCHESIGVDNVNVIHDVDYLSRWTLFDADACYDLLRHCIALNDQDKELKSICNKERAKVAELNDRLAHESVEKHILVYVDGNHPIIVKGGTSWSFKGEFLYVYSADGDKIAAFVAESVLGVSLGGGDLSK